MMSAVTDGAFRMTTIAPHQHVLLSPSTAITNSVGRSSKIVRRSSVDSSTSSRVSLKSMVLALMRGRLGHRLERRGHRRRARRHRAVAVSQIRLFRRRVSCHFDASGDQQSRITAGFHRQFFNIASGFAHGRHSSFSPPARAPTRWRKRVIIELEQRGDAPLAARRFRAVEHQQAVFRRPSSIAFIAADGSIIRRRRCSR